MSVSIDKITVERYEYGLGIFHEKPRLSWRFSGDAKDWIQASYTLHIERSGRTTVHTINSQASVHVPWPEAPLTSREIARVTVVATGEDGSQTKPAAAVIEAALLHRSDWSAQMISGEAQPKGAIKRPYYFERTFVLDHIPQKARVYATAFGIYKLTLNGKAVGDHVLSPGWQSYKHRLHYQTFDVTALLKTGNNVWQAVLTDGWYCGRLSFGGGRRDIWGPDMGLMAQLEIDGRVIVTDDDWKWGYGPILSSEIYDGEVYDANQEDIKYDQAVRVIAGPGAGCRLIASEAPPVRRMETVRAKEIIKTPSGKTIVDFGQNLVGWLKIHSVPPVGSTKLVFSHAEVLEHGELGTRPLRQAKCQDTIILGGRDVTGWEPLGTFHGFRYAQVEGWDDLQLADLSATVVHSDLEPLGSFECSHGKINQLWSNITWGMKGNFVSVPTDCPQRDERLGWTGDLQVFAPTAAFLFNVGGFLGSWLQDLDAEQREYGGRPNIVVPDVLQTWGPPQPQAIWSDVTALCPWDLYVASCGNDRRILEDQYHSMTTWLNYGIPRSDTGNRLWKEDTLQLGDWLDPSAPPDDPGDGRTDPLLAANAYLCHVTKTVAKVSQILGKTSEAERYEADYLKVRESFRREYVTRSGRIVSDSQTGIALALRFGLVDSYEAEHAVERLAFLISKKHFKIGTGFAGTPIILQTLADHGKLAVAYRMLQEKKNPSWLYSVSMGATTMWERWDSMLPDGTINPGEMTSFNHYALGSVASFLTGYVGGLSVNVNPVGVSPSEPSFILQPRPGGTVKSASVSHLSPYGRILCSWRIDEGRLQVSVKIPPNTRARLVLPGKDQVIGSGVYDFTTPYVADPAWPPKAFQVPFLPPVPDEFAE